MEDLKQRIEHLQGALHIDQAKNRIADLSALLEKSDVWDDPEHGAELAKELTQHQTIVSEWQNVADMLDVAGEEDRTEIEKELNKLELATYLQGPNDGAAAILAIHAGTGGVEAMDWAMMLARMYTRYAEKAGFNVTTLETSPGEEAGLKSVTMRFAGSNAYGYLKGESGTHRLVRLSPFNAAHLRQTSFVLVEVVPELVKLSLNIPESDIKMDVFHASGHGGQGVNTTNSAVRLTHLPTKTSVTCQNERSQTQNKETAMRILTSRLQLLMNEEHLSELSQLKPGVIGSWGNQIRSYVMQPYTLVKDHRTEVETSNVQGVLDGDIDLFIQAELKKN